MSSEKGNVKDSRGPQLEQKYMFRVLRRLLLIFTSSRKETCEENEAENSSVGYSERLTGRSWSPSLGRKLSAKRQRGSETWTRIR